MPNFGNGEVDYKKLKEDLALADNYEEPISEIGADLKNDYVKSVTEKLKNLNTTDIISICEWYKTALENKYNEYYNYLFEHEDILKQNDGLIDYMKALQEKINLVNGDIYTSVFSLNEEEELSDENTKASALNAASTIAYVISSVKDLEDGFNKKMTVKNGFFPETPNSVKNLEGLKKHFDIVVDNPDILINKDSKKYYTEEELNNEKDELLGKDSKKKDTDEELKNEKDELLAREKNTKYDPEAAELKLKTYYDVAKASTSKLSNSDEWKKFKHLLHVTAYLSEYVKSNAKNQDRISLHDINKRNKKVTATIKDYCENMDDYIAYGIGMSITYEELCRTCKHFYEETKKAALEYETKKLEDHVVSKADRTAKKSKVLNRDDLLKLSVTSFFTKKSDKEDKLNKVLEPKRSEINKIADQKIQKAKAAGNQKKLSPDNKQELKKEEDVTQVKENFRLSI